MIIQRWNFCTLISLKGDAFPENAGQILSCLCSTPSYFGGHVCESYIHPHIKRHRLTDHLILLKKIHGTQAACAVPQHKKQSVQIFCFQFIRKEYKIAKPQILQEKDQKGDMTSGVSEDQGRSWRCIEVTFYAYVSQPNLSSYVHSCAFHPKAEYFEERVVLHFEI